MSDHDRVFQAITAAWDEGCPVASDAEVLAAAALRRVATVGRRRRQPVTRSDRIEDLAKGLRDAMEPDRDLVGPLMEDYRFLALKIIDALDDPASR